MAAAVVAAALAVAGGCGGGDVGGSGPDAGLLDAAVPDAAVPRDFWYLMDSVQVPETANEAYVNSIDVDGDGQGDNALGGLLAALDGEADLPAAATHTQAVEAGRALTMVGLDEVVLADDGPVPVLVAPGDDLDGDPADNFSGAEEFALAPLEGADGELPGAIESAVLRAGPGTVPVLLAIAGVPAGVIELRGVGGRIECLAGADTLVNGRFGVGLTMEEVDTRLVPAMATGIDAIVQRDCPGAVCAEGSQGQSLAMFFDDDTDGAVTEQELRSNSLISSTIGNPDLDLFDGEGQFNPRTDGVKDSLSLSLGFSAVSAALAE